MRRKNMIAIIVIALILSGTAAFTIYARDSGENQEKYERNQSADMPEAAEELSASASAGSDEGGLRITVLSGVEREGSEVLLPPYEEVCLLAADGKKYEASGFDGKDTFTFSSVQKPQDGMQLILPYLMVRENGVRTELTLQKNAGSGASSALSEQEGEIFTLGSRRLILEGAEWSDYTEQFNMKSPDGRVEQVSQPAQRITLRIGTIPEPAGEPKAELESVTVEAAEADVNRYEMDGMEFHWSDPYRFEEEDVFTVTNLLRGTDEARIILSDPVWRIGGEVRIDAAGRNR